MPQASLSTECHRKLPPFHLHIQEHRQVQYPNFTKFSKLLVSKNIISRRAAEYAEITSLISERTQAWLFELRGRVRREPPGEISIRKPLRKVQ